MDYELLFKNKALEDFHLFADDFFQFIDLTFILHEINESCKNDLGEYDIKRGMRKLEQLIDKYVFISNNPAILTKDDQIAIYDMKRYLNSNKGKEYGYLKYRKQHFEDQVVKYYNLAMERNMFILANIHNILHEIQKMKIFLIQHQESLEVKAKQFYSNNKAKVQRAEWARQKNLCVCGKYYSKGDKYSHLKTKFHKEFIETNSNKSVTMGDGENITLTIEEIYPEKNIDLFPFN